EQLAGLRAANRLFARGAVAGGEFPDVEAGDRGIAELRISIQLECCRRQHRAFDRDDRRHARHIPWLGGDWLDLGATRAVSKILAFNGGVAPTPRRRAPAS